MKRQSRRAHQMGPFLNLLDLSHVPISLPLYLVKSPKAFIEESQNLEGDWANHVPATFKQTNQI